MSNPIYIDDDGDECVFVRVQEDVIARITHEAYGWGGMREVVAMVEEIADAYGIEVYNTQSIV